MIKALGGISLLVIGTAASAASQPTDFGVRAIGGLPSAGPVATVPLQSARSSVSAAASIGAQWGRVTSTYRTPAHNRRVGGVRNSYHLSGRAIDIARRPGVSHWQIAAAYRAAGYHLVESLDEGDHSHFAFGSGLGAPQVRRMATQVATKAERIGETRWRVVYAPAGNSR